MNVELRNHWYTMCLIPHEVSAGSLGAREKFVACLLGDELADDDEFRTLSDGVVKTHCFGPCHWKYDGACFHPFRPGNLFDAIFTSVFRGDPNAEQLVSKEAEKSLDCRDCSACMCTMGVSRWTLLESAFHWVGRMYDDMMESVSKHGTLYGRPWEEFRKGYSGYIDRTPFFDGGSFKQYEGNVRLHLDRLAERHYRMLEHAVCGSEIPYEKIDEAVGNALRTVRFELVMHFSNYWEKELYKKGDA